MDPIVIQTTLLIITGLLTTLFVVSNSHAIARRKATLEVILKAEDNPHYQKNFERFLQMSINPNSIVNMSNTRLIEMGPPSTWHKNKLVERKDFDHFLNHYETIAIGIYQSILDREIYKDWWRSTYVRHYIKSYNYIYFHQTVSSDIYKNFSDLAYEWMNCEEELEWRRLREENNAEYKAYLIAQSKEILAHKAKLDAELAKSEEATVVAQDMADLNDTA